MDILKTLEEVVRDVFFDRTIELTRDHTANDVAGWDSLSHVRLLLTIERRFAIRIAPTEATRLSNVGELADLIDDKMRRDRRSQQP